MKDITVSTEHKNDLFNDPDLWENYDPENHIANKINYLERILPDDVLSILDVGCGNGLITNHFARERILAGTDLSFAALKHVNCARAQASADYLPFKDKSFDLVFSSELLEHLPKTLLDGTINEIGRIARKYILLTVPNSEFLDVNFIKCPVCDHIFHSYGHLHSFSPNQIKNLVGSNFNTIHTSYTGQKIRSYRPMLLNLKRISGKHWFPANEHTRCPNCGNRTFLNSKPSLLSKICNGLNQVISGKKHYWLIMLFERTNSARYDKNRTNNHIEP